jgi:hypothetical protein
MDVAEFRCPSRLREQARQQADRDGVSFSEFVRSSLAFRIAWIGALDAIRAGTTPSNLTDIEQLVRILSSIKAPPPP